ncbi:hypothetical protein ACOMHN_057259 [Nucella lapillus]
MHTSGTVSFTSNPDGDRFYFTNIGCTTNDIRPPGACSFTPGSLGCGCTGRNKDIYYVEYNFNVSAFMHRSWKPIMACINKHWEAGLHFKGKGCIYPASDTSAWPSKCEGSQISLSLWILTFAVAPVVIMLPQAIAKITN